MNYPFGPKSTWLQQACQILSGKIMIPENELPKLLNWLKDANWPGAIEIGEFLVEKPYCILEGVREVLLQEDMIWKYWVLELLVSRLDANACGRISLELWDVAIAFDSEDVHIKALEICAYHQLADSDLLNATLSQKIQSDPSNTSTYERIREGMSGGI